MDEMFVLKRTQFFIAANAQERDELLAEGWQLDHVARPGDQVILPIRKSAGILEAAVHA